MTNRPNNLPLQTWRRDLPLAAGIAFIYFLLARVSLEFVAKPEGFAMIWLPSGLLLAALLVAERRSRGPIIACVFLTIAGVNIVNGNTLAVSFGFAFANSLEPALAAYLFGRFIGFPANFDRIRHVIGFLLVSVIASNALTALVGAAVPALGFGTSYWRSYLIWFIEDGMGMMIMTPLVAAFYHERSSAFSGMGWKKTLEFLVLVSVFIECTLLSFDIGPGNIVKYIDPYAVAPLLIWALLRFRGAKTSLLVLLMAGIGIYATKIGIGPFADRGDTILSVMTLQIFLGIISMTAMMMSASLAERARANDHLQRSQQLLTETERVGKVGGWEFNIDSGKQIWTPEVYSIHEVDSTFDPTLESGVDFYTPESRPVIAQAVQRAIQHGESFDLDLAIVTAKGNLRNVHAIGHADLARRRMYGFFQDITGRKQAEGQVLRSLREKEVMLKEIHHRVKNNMQVITSLLNLQAKEIADPAVRALFDESRNRIQSMALVHERLYRAEDLAHIDFKEYLQSLLRDLSRAISRPGVTLSVDMESVPLDVNAAVPCGLIVNELVSNSLKYAFPDGRKGAIRAGIIKNPDKSNLLFVADNGAGFPGNIDFRNTGSLGLRLVNVLAGQLHGTIEMLQDGGTEFRITFPGK